MGVYIKNMEMPKTGQIVLVEIDENGDVFAAYDGGRTKLTQHKAVPVPPHGRLGDLDALAQQIEHDRFHHTHTDGLAARHHVAEYGHFLTAISYAPTVIPATVS